MNKLSYLLCVIALLVSSCSHHKYVFVTKDMYDGNLGGLEGADLICQTHADAANLPGVYKAWLSDSQYSATERLSLPRTKYIRVDGTPVSYSKTDWIDTYVAAPLRVNEYGVLLSEEHRVWTGTGCTGYVPPNTSCSDWQSAEQEQQGIAGSPYVTDNHWTEGVWATCNRKMSLYCIQQ